MPAPLKIPPLFSVRIRSPFQPCRGRTILTSHRKYAASRSCDPEFFLSCHLTRLLSASAESYQTGCPTSLSPCSVSGTHSSTLPAFQSQSDTLPGQSDHHSVWSSIHNRHSRQTDPVEDTALLPEYPRESGFVNLRTFQSVIRNCSLMVHMDVDTMQNGSDPGIIMCGITAYSVINRNVTIRNHHPPPNP